MKRAVPLALALLTAIAGAAPGGADLEEAAMRTAQTLGGVLRDCPASFARIGFPEKRCVGVGDTVEVARAGLNSAMANDLYGVWRSRDGQRSVYNWLKTAGGYIYLRLQPDPDGRAQTLLYLDLPPEQTGAAQTDRPATETTPAAATQIGGVTLTPAVSAPHASEASSHPETVAPSQPAQTPPPTAGDTASVAAAATPSPGVAELAPVPFGRTLRLQEERLNGPDVLAVQNRLIALMRPARPGRGDSWYGPVTAQTVRVFQKANGLPVTGVVDRVTWERLFSAQAQRFDAPAIP
ncbi:peptidoglycan-binding domain-containing protein [Deinococcus humi]|uniref:Peptidoglycan binding-like domain-containing protein n=1 Tax=Deinococcus humi TaxID=662880 RepID=A0A7W8JRI0_9DEIO|nr:peptidoglycan-binding domain-containing protein [Deinococcus humi]MBB5361600.1 hypothetical protein [Deinococcus humi]GGO20919.1 hypothetical protein GCM10008949_06580 [Deinococcus humi]